MNGLKVGLIGGSGLGQTLEAAASSGNVQRHAVETPFGLPSDTIYETRWGDVPVLLLSRHGPGHRFSPSQVPYRANLFALKQLGCTHILASGAVGSLREEFKPKDLVIPDQIIDKTSRRPGTFYEDAAVHVEFAEPFCATLRQILMESAPAAPATSEAKPAFKVHDRGCYVCMEGPAFSTRAESLMHRLWGGDLIGMTAMPEAKLAREAEMAYALIALVTDYDCWRQPAPAKPKEGVKDAATTEKADPFVLLKEIQGNLAAASENAIALMKSAVERMAGRAEELMASPARDALKLAIWSDKRSIPRDKVDRLSALWGRHFESDPSSTSSS